jgi:transcription initiation factor TFIIIB Brf1 subunit/transcription initiation factor TFIIB
MNLFGLISGRTLRADAFSLLGEPLTSVPLDVAAAALYIASVLLGERKTQRDVADIAGVTEVTIRNRYKELTEQLDMGVTL